MYIPLEPDERIVATVHRHWWFVMVRAVMAAVIAALPLLLLALLERVGILTTTDMGRSLAVVWALWALVVWVTFWNFWTLYWLDTWVITTKRLIDIDYKRLFDRNIAMLRLDKIQDVTFEVKGVFGSLLGYGSISVQTAGESREFVMDQIADPEALKDIIMKQVNAAASAPQKVTIVPASQHWI